MKTIQKSSCPPHLRAYAATHPQDTWDAMRGNAADGGDKAYEEARRQIFQDQCKLCAYCESEVDVTSPHHCHIEHFHPKSASSPDKNWGLDWNNLLGVCSGGIKERDQYLFPQNMSCDAHKEDKICDDALANPLHLPPFPAAFLVNRGTGELYPHELFCTQYQNLQPNKFSTTRELLENTISILNLNCDRLCQARLLVSRNIEHQKRDLRKRGLHPTNALLKLAQRYFGTPWPRFFTTVRCCLGESAENSLRSINFQG